MFCRALTSIWRFPSLTEAVSATGTQRVHGSMPCVRYTLTTIHKGARKRSHQADNLCHPARPGEEGSSAWRAHSARAIPRSGELGSGSASASGDNRDDNGGALHCPGDHGVPGTRRSKGDIPGARGLCCGSKPGARGSFCPHCPGWVWARGRGSSRAPALTKRRTYTHRSRRC